MSNRFIELQFQGAVVLILYQSGGGMLHGHAGTNEVDAYKIFTCYSAPQILFCNHYFPFSSRNGSMHFASEALICSLYKDEQNP